MSNRRSPPDALAAARHIEGECIAMRARRLSRAVTRIFDAALRPHGIGTAQLNMLVAMTRAGPLHPFQLARALDLDKSTVARNLERMRARGWVLARSDAEGNGYTLEVKPAGRALLERAFPAWQAAQERARREVGEAFARAILDVGNTRP
jgi:DNA-binding MarR family transcriptional regulator